MNKNPIHFQIFGYVICLTICLIVSKLTNMDYTHLIALVALLRTFEYS